MRDVFENTILLKFGTATEVSNYGFEIQRATKQLKL